MKISVLLNVQETFSPSFKPMFTEGRVTDCVPPLGLDTEQVIPAKLQLGGMVSVIVYVLNSIMLLNTFVFVVVPSSTSEKFDNGKGDAVKAKGVELFGAASLMIVMEAG